LIKFFSDQLIPVALPDKSPSVNKVQAVITVAFFPNTIAALIHLKIIAVPM